MKQQGMNAESNLEQFGKKMSSAFGSALNGLKNVGKGQTPVPPPIPVVKYYVAVNGQQTGPFDMSVLSDMAANGSLTPASLVWKAGMKNWDKAENIDELKDLFQGNPNEQPPVIPQ